MVGFPFRGLQKGLCSARLLILLSLTSALNGMAQSPAVDSLVLSLEHAKDTSRVRLLNTIATLYSVKDVRKSQDYITESLSLAKNLEFHSGEAEALCIGGSLLSQQGNFAEALKWCRQGEEIYSMLQNPVGIADAKKRIGMVHLQQGDNSKALENFAEAERIQRELNHDKEVAALHENIGLVHFRQQDFEAALDAFRESLAYYESHGNIAAASKLLVNMGAVLNKLKRPKEALDANLKAFKYFEQSGNQIGIGIASNNIGNVYLELKDYAEALSYYQKSFNIKEKMNDKRGMSVTLKNTAEVYLALGNINAAGQYASRSRAIAEEIGSNEQARDAYDILMQVSEKKGDLRAALDYSRKLAIAKDSLFSREKTEQLTRLRALYETDRVQHEANMKDAQITILNKQQELNSVQRNLLFVALGALLVITLVVAYFLFQKQKSNKLLSERAEIIQKSLAERETLLKEIHHRVKNNLQIITSLLSLQSRTIESEVAHQAISESRNRVKSMSLIHEQLYQKDTISGIFIADYVQKLAEGLRQSYGRASGNVELVVDCEPLVLDADTAIPIGLILNELISNALKHAFPDDRSGKIEISMHEREHVLELIVADNGVGKAGGTSANGSSFGLSLVHSLMRKLRAEMRTPEGVGTRVELVFRDYQKVIPVS